MAESDRSETKDDEQAESELKVTDRRLFTSEGVLRQDLREEEDPKEEASAQTAAFEEPAAPPRPAVEPEARGFDHRPVEEPAGVDFTMLINGMAQPALLFMGEIPHPETGEAKVDLEQARIQIDMLELLRVKCRGNLSSDEDGLLDRMLYQLRMLYVSKSSQSG